MQKTTVDVRLNLRLSEKNAMPDVLPIPIVIHYDIY